MSEPTAQAASVLRIAPGLLHWTIHDERIDFRSEAYAIDSGGRHLLIDPLPVTEHAQYELEPVDRIVITGGFHQRAAWSFRRRYGAEVFAPRGAIGLAERPDGEYDDGAWLVPGLRALHRPGPTQPHFVLDWDGPAGRVLFCADLLMREADGPFHFVPDEHQDDPLETRRSVERLVDGCYDALCPAHGAPALLRGSHVLEQALV